jgi:hypothetical protein
MKSSVFSLFSPSLASVFVRRHVVAGTPQGGGKELEAALNGRKELKASLMSTEWQG